MHRDKTVARILLILSVVHVAAAAPAIVRQRSLDVDEDVTAALEKRGNSGNTPQDSHPVPQMDNDPPPASGTAQLDDDPQPASGASQLHSNPPLVLGTPQLHGDSPTASETSSAHDNPPFDPFASDDENRFNDVHHAPSSHESETPPTNNRPNVYYAPWSHETETPPNENYFNSYPSSHESDAPPTNNRPIVYYAPSSHESETPPNDNHLSSYAPSSHESETPPNDNHFNSYAPSLHEPEMSNSHFISDKSRRFAAYGVIGVSLGLTLSALIYGVHYKATHHHSQHTGRDLTSSDVVGRGVSTHPRHPRKLVSRVLANLRNEDLRLLSVPTRKALERLD